MAHGIKPYGRTQAQETIFGMQDMGELAARLKSIITHDRRGDVVWLDDFESGIEKWAYAGTGAGNAQEWSSENARSGGFSFKHICGSDGTLESRMWKEWAYPILGPMGLEMSLNLDADISLFELDFWLDNGVDRRRAEIRHTPATTLWEYRNSVPVWVPLVPLRGLEVHSTIFHMVKLVADFSVPEYMRLMVDDLTYNLAGLPIWTPFTAPPPYLYAQLTFTGTAAQHAVAFVDDVILTQNEP